MAGALLPTGLANEFNEGEPVAPTARLGATSDDGSTELLLAIFEGPEAANSTVLGVGLLGLSFFGDSVFLLSVFSGALALVLGAATGGVDADVVVVFDAGAGAVAGCVTGAAACCCGCCAGCC